MHRGEVRDESIALAQYAQARELQKYYQPWLNSTTLDNVPVDDVAGRRSSVRPSHDTTLTALAQLAALRLRVKRGMVSLVGVENQVILAEATQTLSLVDQNRHAPGDHIWLGQVSVPRKDAVCGTTFGSKYTVHDAEGNEQTFNALVIPDLAQDGRFKDRPYVMAEPGVKFYAGVPITTKQGFEIGVYAVSDLVPRPAGLSVDEVLFMQDCAQIAADHLDRIKTATDSEKDEVFVRGMHKFIEGLSTLKQDLGSPIKNLGRSDSNGPQNEIRATDPQEDDISWKDEQQGELSNNNKSIKDREKRSDHATSEPMKEPGNKQHEAHMGEPRHAVETSTPGKEDTDTSAYNSKQIFSRAAMCLREVLGAQACVFLDASSGLFGSEGVLTRPSSESPHVFLPDAEFESDDGDAPLTELENNATVLAKALDKAELNDVQDGLMKKKHLRACLLRYPHGQFFYVNEGKVVPSISFGVDRDENGRKLDWWGRKPRLGSHVYRTYLPRQLLDQLPNVKWLIFLPIFDFAHGQWCAGTFLWSSESSARDLEAVMPYLKTFGSCLISELTSLEAFNTSLAKSTFIASISHDLRSPLHGMLGSLEFLEDTMVSAYQTSLLGSIETCGKTLMDTIDHLLDYAKINNLNRDMSGKKSVAKDEHRMTNMSTFDFAVLLEEVVEAVFAGQTFRKQRLNSHDPVDEAASRIHAIGLDDSNTTDENIHSGSAKFSGRVFFILDIFRSKSWCTKGQAGALRRMILNIVGNAIKYCNKGCIQISLDIKDVVKGRADVELIVRDTGVGMSQQFMENSLFKAFSQEDPYAPGAGLGLSIASSIVHTLHGKIRVESEKNVGTNVIMTIPMELTPASECQQDSVFENAARVAAGKRACLLNPLLEGEKTEQLSKLTASIARSCQEYFQMDCYESASVDGQDETAIFVYCEPPPIEYLLKHHSERKEVGKRGHEAALLIICTNAFEAAALRQAGVAQLVNLGRIVEVISQPVGPRKLAKVLLSCLQRVEDLAQRTSNTVPAAISKQLNGTNEAHHRASTVDWHRSTVVYDNEEGRHRPAIDDLKWKSEEVVATGRAFGLPRQPPASYGDIKAGKLPSSDALPWPNGDKENNGSGSQLPSILLVDDNAINLKLLVTFMKKIKLPYAEAVNGLDALNKFKEAHQPFDFVLMDLQMPIMDGLESTRKIREHEKHMNFDHSATIIAITGVGSEDVRKEALDAGMTQYLTKPVKFKALQQILEQGRQH